MTVMKTTFDAKPIRTKTRAVQPEWIDYNGHMNVAYYILAIDTSLDEAFDDLGIGVALVKSHRMGPMALGSQIHYLDEMFEGQRFNCDVQILDADHKRMHMFVTMNNLDKGTVAATYESLSMNVDLEARKSANYPEEVLPTIMALKEAHAGLPAPELAGARIGIRRKP